MTKLISQKLVQLNLKRTVERRVLILRRCISCFWEKILLCSIGKPIQYRLLPCSTMPSRSSSILEIGLAPDITMRPSLSHSHHQLDADNLVALKISLLGDCHIGKTSFVGKYVGDEKQRGGSPEEGLNLMDKTLLVRGAKISYSIWEVAGDSKSRDHLPVACKDSIAILFMFDLTSRCTLKSVITWYQQAIKFNQTAIPIIIGTKFDEFMQLPIDLQWTIASQARAYAKALNATLFFSSATYNINVNKIFKFITAKFFDLPWTLERNLTIGEPIIDF